MGLQPPGYAAPGAQPPKQGNRGLVVALVSIVGVLALLCVAGIVGVFWFLRDDDTPLPGSSSIPGLVDYRKDHPDWLSRDHRPQEEDITYPMTPPAGGPHHPVWQQCKGDVYTAPIDNGNAVHSLEHGAVWITYQPGLPSSDVEKLATRVRGNDYLLLSPYPGQLAKVSLQAWGYQLQVSSVDDRRIDDFVERYRQTATLEPGTPCSTGVTATEGG
ncbi:DUF3105 domain-containing protein [Dactylosporangium roseum]